MAGGAVLHPKSVVTHLREPHLKLRGCERRRHGAARQWKDRSYSASVGLGWLKIELALPMQRQFISALIASIRSLRLPKHCRQNVTRIVATKLF
jgi:hypothetical protein